MSVEKIALGINLRKNKISTSAGFGKYYPEVDTQKTLSLRGFAQHMVDHGSIYGRAVVEGVLMQIVDCLPELVAQGVPVQLGSLGTFYPTAEVMPKTGAVPNIAAMDGLNPNDIVKAIHIRYLPDSTKLDNLCGPQFKNRCTLELRNIVDTQEVTIDGKTKKVQTLKPIATAVAELKAGGSNSNGGGGSTNTNPTNPTNGGSSENQTVAAPTISGNSSFSDTTQVTISGPDGAAIHYTTDGTVPTAESTLYSEAFALSATTTVKAIAIKDGQSSEVASRVFTKSSNDDGMGQD